VIHRDRCYDVKVPSLLAILGPKRGIRIEIRDTLILGRAASADVQLVDEKVSREHCRLDSFGKEVTVSDLNSQNGTFINGSRLAPQTPTPLSAGDELWLGDSLLVFEAQAELLAARFGDGAIVLPDSEAEPESQVHSPAGAMPNHASPLLLHAVLELGGALARSPNLEGSVNAVLDSILAMLPAAHAFVLKQSPTGPRPIGGRSSTDQTMTVSRTLLNYVEQRGRPAILTQVGARPGAPKSRSVLAMLNRSMAAAPVPGPHGIAGFLCIDREGKNTIFDDDILTLGVLAQTVGSSGLLSAKPTDERISHRPTGLDAPVGHSPAFKRALERAAAAAESDSTVLINGEPGTGKEEVARFIHKHSWRQDGPFVTVNCGAIEESLAASDLFGHEKGAFTGATHTHLGVFEAAEGGTLFLDEVGELSPSLQVQLLRVLQERVLFRLGSNTARSIDVRIIAATHRALDSSGGTFKQDLFYRLNVVPIVLPPLRDRGEDLPSLCLVLLDRITQKVGRRVPSLAVSGLSELGKWHWPGNIRELANVLERMSVLAPPRENHPFDSDDVRAALGMPVHITSPQLLVGMDSTLEEKLAMVERHEIRAALEEHRGVKSHAAQALGISRPALDNKIEEHGIDLWSTSERPS